MQFNIDLRALVERLVKFEAKPVERDVVGMALERVFCFIGTRFEFSRVWHDHDAGVSDWRRKTIGRTSVDLLVVSFSHGHSVIVQTEPILEFT